MKHVTTKREPTAVERRKRIVGVEIADATFRAIAAKLPLDPQTRRYACERLARLIGAQVATDHGEAALHSALNGAVVAGAPAYRTEKPARAAAEALFRDAEGEG